MPQDYSGQNLRGRSFRGQNLEEANFSGADIRSADFTGAKLKGANFRNAKAGLKKRWVTFLVFVSWVQMGLSGFISAFSGALMVWLVFYRGGSDQIVNQIAVWAVIVTLVLFIFVTIHQGIQAGLGAIAVAVAFAFTVAVAVAGAGAVAQAIAVARAVAFAGAAAGAGVVGLAVAFSVAFSVAGAVAGVVAVAFVFAFAFVGAFVGAKAFLGAFVGAKAFAVTFAVGFSVAAVLVLLSIYIGWRSLTGDEKYPLIRNIAVGFAAFKGTSFRNADLSNADFTAATLKSTDFRKTILTRTYFYKTEKLDLARPGTTYLQKTLVRQALVTGQGQDKNFDRFDLRGVNFKEAILTNASFIGADLSLANLQNANLSKAKLVQTQLDGTDFTGAILTGAYIEDWGITAETKLDKVDCKYVFMRLPTLDNPEPWRKPDNKKEEFGDGGFADFIRPLKGTLDLYHNQQVDPRAVSIAFNQLSQNHPEAELSIAAVEVRGENNEQLLLRAKVAEGINLSELSEEYFVNYNHLKSLPQEALILLLTTQGNQIRILTSQVDKAIEKPNYDLRGAKFGSGFAGTGGTQSGGTFYDYSSNPSLAQAATEIQQLLQQLEANNPTTTNADKRAVVNQAIDVIENNPALKAKVIAALNASGTEALKTAINHPLAKNMMPFIEELAD